VAEAQSQNFFEDNIFFHQNMTGFCHQETKQAVIMGFNFRLLLLWQMMMIVLSLSLLMLLLLLVVVVWRFLLLPQHSQINHRMNNGDDDHHLMPAFFCVSHPFVL
jgi:hypothetical protein